MSNNSKDKDQEKSDEVLRRLLKPRTAGKGKKPTGKPHGKDAKDQAAKRR